MQIIVLSVTGAELVRFTLKEGENLIGRKDPESGIAPNIDLSSYDPEVKVSRSHAILTKKGNTLTLRDNDSLNGTFLNRGTKLDPGVVQTLRVGDEIIIGKTYLKVAAA